MRFAKAFLIIAGVLAVLGFGLWHFFLKDQVAFADVASAYVAKQTCSCVFVAERELASCLTDFTQDVSQLDVTQAEGRVTASALGLISSTAIHQPDLGCVLEPS